MLDTNICIYILEGRSRVAIERLAECGPGEVCLSAISLAELAMGHGERALEDPALQALLREIAVLDFDAKAVFAYARLPFRRARYDRLIAAHAISVDASLVTNDLGGFSDIPSLRLENWAA